jgi:hypothetical protein
VGRIFADFWDSLVSVYNSPPPVFKIIAGALSRQFVVVKQRINAAFLFFLLTAFLAVQWTPAHAHLTAHHEHSGEKHQHSAEAHAHQAAAHHADAIDAGHAPADEARVVELDHDALSSLCWPLDTPSAPFAVEVRSPPFIEAIAFDLPEDRNVLPDTPPPHIGQPRAPPPRV